MRSEAGVRIAVLRLPGGAGLPLPTYMTEGAAGADVAAAIEAPLVMQPGARAVVPAGFRVAVPPGYEMQVRPRSGLALSSGVTVLNAPGTIDSDYRGSVNVVLINLGESAVTINRGDRIAQLVVAPVVRAAFLPVDSIDPTSRDGGGFGSTG